MDISQELIQNTVLILTPLLPYLLKGGKIVAQKAFEEAGKKLTDSSWELAEKVWGKVKPKTDTSPDTKAALEKAAQKPEEKRAVLLEAQIEDMLAEDPALAKEIGQIIQVGEGSLVAKTIKNSNIALGANPHFGDNYYLGANTPQDNPVSVERLREKYLKSLADRCEKLPLGTIHQTLEDAEHDVSISLENVYIDLDVTPHMREERGQKITEMNERAPQRIPIIEALEDEKMRRVVLLGEAGSGKTTCVNYLMIALSAIQQKMMTEKPLKQDSPLANYFPVRLILREVASEYIPSDVKKGGVDILWNALRGQLERELGAADAEKFFPYLKTHLETSPCLIVLDGLDEVAETEERRPRLLEAIQAFSNSLLKDSILIVTARPYTYDNPKWYLPKFTTLDLLGFSPEQMSGFITRFYLAIQPIKNWDDVVVKTRCEKLNEAIQEREYLRNLAERPLLLTLIASVDSSGAKLPEDRAELYEQTINLLLQRWQQRKDDSAGETNTTIALSYTSDILDALKKLAYEVHKRQAALPSAEGAENTPADINKHEIWDAFESSLLKNSKVTLDDLLEFLEKRTGLLAGRGDKVYAFAHRSFQEYLAARHVISTPGDEFNLKTLIQNSPKWWREVVLLAIAQINRNGSALKSAFKELYDFVPFDVEKKPNKTELDWQAAVIAGEALVEMRLKETMRGEDYYKIYIERIATWLVQLLEQNALTPRERAEAGNTLSKLGDPRLGVMNDFLFCKIDEGKFLMGSKEGEEHEDKSEYPQFIYEIKQPYYLSRYPVTSAQFELFVKADGYKKKDYWGEANQEGYWSVDGFKGRYDNEVRNAPISYSAPYNLSNHPVVGVSWHEALAFTRWLTEQLNAGEIKAFVWSKKGKPKLLSLKDEKSEARLPTEAEWERAARGGRENQVYPWKGDITPNHANYRETQIGATSAVGLFPAGENDYGLLDMSGNVWEWCLTTWQDSYKDYLQNEKKLNNLEGDVARVLRGGAYGDVDSYLRCACRNHFFDPYLRNDNDGFRVVVCVVSPISP
ncbi:MAG: SUMF1/EgtB/PvdO family nonheme iron enzyme [Chloroflexi bacterium]|nr:SUMF1/EgtB/PvdO family nonheme iron enzyme [Chloroflexota bacterium]